MDIQEYNDKRDFSKTSEPKGVISDKEGQVFCVQEHHASHHHFDFRLELNGALKSWAVPKGPSTDPSNKRLAVHVEDHPLDYADFEGVIPDGEYGAGEVLLWDKGEWSPLKDPDKGYKSGRLEFELKGQKLKGKWALIRMRGQKSKNWLLIKMKDDHASEEDILEARPESVKKKAVEKIEPQLAVTREAPPKGDGFIREIKQDGYRTMVSVKDKEGLVYSRNGKDWSSKLSFILEAIRDSKISEVILDGETVLLDKNGVSSFSALHRAMSSSSPQGLRFYAFDLLRLNGEDLRERPQIERKKLLSKVIEKINSPRVLYSEHFEEEGEMFFEKMAEFNLEGMMSKRKDSPYISGRNENWIKTKCLKTEPFAIVGFAYKKDSDHQLGSLLVARKNEKGSMEVGKVGTGLSKRDREELLKRINEIEAPSRSFEVPQNYKTRDLHYCAPEIVAQIKFSEVTENGSLRHPVFEGEREDLSPAQVLEWETSEELIRKILTSPQRKLWPEITKKEYAQYLMMYKNQIGPWLYRRPLTLFKCPKGAMEDSCFFSKHKGNMHGLKEITVPMKNNKKGKEQEFFEVRDEKGLLYIARYSGVEFHVWNSTSKDPWIAQEIVLDLDPGSGVKEETLIEAALKIRKMLEALKLECFPKTTGKKGLHLHIPLRPIYEVNQIYQLSKSIAFILEEEMPKLFTSSSRIKDREGKIFIDYLRNSFGATFIAPFSPRANKEATIALPLNWSDLEGAKKLPRMTLREALERQITSPWEDYWSHAQKVDLFEKV